MTRGPRKHTFRYRWLAPDGRKGRWRKTRQGAETGAINTRHSSLSGGVVLRFCARSAVALWPTIETEGWEIEVERMPK